MLKCAKDPFVRSGLWLIIYIFIALTLNESVSLVVLHLKNIYQLCDLGKVIEKCNTSYEPHHEMGLGPGPTQTGLYSHRRWLQAWNLGFSIEVEGLSHQCSELTALISSPFIVKLICAFVFA